MSERLFAASGIFHPESGGPATYLYEILPELQRAGWDVRLMAYGSSPLDSYPYPVKRIPRSPLPIRLAHYGLAAYPLLRWADLVYVHSLDLPLYGGGARRVVKIVGDQAWERAVRKGWIPATEDIDDFQKRSYTPVVASQQASRSRQVRAMDGVIVPSEYLKRMVVGWGVDEARVHVIYNALPPALSDHLTQAEARVRLKLPERPLLLTAARLTTWKGINHIITALKALPDVYLLIAGEGDQEQALRQQSSALGLQERVTFLGKIARDQLALYMKAVDYLALYSGYEGLSHTLLESLQAATPVIASDKGGNPEIVRHGENGLLVPYVDVPRLVETLREAFSPGVRSRLAANSALGLERFNFGRMVAQTSAVLRSYR